MATIRIEMTDESKSVFVDEYSLAFHMHYYRCGLQCLLKKRYILLTGCYALMPIRLYDHLTLSSCCHIEPVVVMCIPCLLMHVISV
jgi:hypothetical protein